MNKPNKQDVFNQILVDMQRNLDFMMETTSQLQDAVIEAPKSQEVHGETQKTELGLLAAGLAERIKLMQENINAMSKFHLRKNNEEVSLGSLVELSVNEKKQTIIILPVCGVKDVRLGEVIVLIISKATPIFALISQKKAGDIVPMNGKKIEIISVE